MIKKLMCVLIALVMVLSLSGCSVIVDQAVGSAVFLLMCATDSDDYADKDSIFAFVYENEESLREAIESNEVTDLENNGIIMDVSTYGDGIEFSCGGAGMGAETYYVGFYYTPDNDMTDVWCAPTSADSLKELGDGYEWKEQQGDNRYYTQKICENFYYYEAEF